MDKYEIRRKRLKDLIDSRYKGNRAAFSAAHDKQASYVSRALLAPGKAHRKRIGEEVARAIEAKEKLPDLWLDTLSDKQPEPPAKVFKGAMKADSEQDPYKLIERALKILVIVGEPRKRIMDEIKQVAEHSKMTGEAFMKEIRSK